MKEKKTDTNKKSFSQQSESESSTSSSLEQLDQLPAPYTHVELIKQRDVKPEQRLHARSTLAQVLDVIVQDHVCDEDFDLIDGEETAGTRMAPEPKAEKYVIDRGALLFLLGLAPGM